ncbi:helix-turn-helix domain-containing protein [Neisseria shayeganii]|nr:helix-turn-helix transcriptional regulator [Neisseria shayeganii]
MEKQAEIHHYRLLFARNMRQIRRLKDISQEELAFQAGISRAYLGDIERGNRSVSIDVMGSIADALQTPLNQLLQTDLTLRLDTSSQPKKG